MKSQKPVRYEVFEISEGGKFRHPLSARSKAVELSEVNYRARKRLIQAPKQTDGPGLITASQKLSLHVC
jgi:hypothetical protein